MNFGCQTSMLSPWGSQLLSEGRNPGQGALGVSEAGAQVLPDAMLGGGFSEQKGKEEEQSRCRTEGKHGLPNSPNWLWECPGYHKAGCPKAPLVGGPGEIAEHLLTLGSATT